MTRVRASGGPRSTVAAPANQAEDNHERTDLDPRRTAVVVIDLQKGIVRFPGNPHSTHSVIANCVALLAAARSVGAQPVLVHVGRVARWRRCIGSDFRRAHAQPGALPPDWSELIPELNRQPNDIVILKRQWGAFYGTDLELQLRRRGLTPSFFAASLRRFGVESTARDAYERGFEQVFAEDAMTGRTAESHATPLRTFFPALAASQHRRDRRRAARGQKRTYVIRDNQFPEVLRECTATDPGPSRSTPPSASRTRRR